MARKAKVIRKTKETSITVEANIDGEAISWAFNRLKKSEKLIKEVS